MIVLHQGSDTENQLFWFFSLVGKTVICEAEVGVFDLKRKKKARQEKLQNKNSWHDPNSVKVSLQYIFERFNLVQLKKVWL